MLPDASAPPPLLQAVPINRYPHLEPRMEETTATQLEGGNRYDTLRQQINVLTLRGPPENFVRREKVANPSRIYRSISWIYQAETGGVEDLHCSKCNSAIGYVSLLPPPCPALTSDDDSRPR